MGQGDLLLEPPNHGFADHCKPVSVRFELVRLVNINFINLVKLVKLKPEQPDRLFRPCTGANTCWIPSKLISECVRLKIFS